MAFDQSEFRRVLGHFATGVTVVTTLDAEGKPAGLTANAVSSVSLDPPLVLVCVDKKAETAACFAASGVFTVNILSEEQEGLSRRFAKSGPDKFSGVGFHAGGNGAPVLEGALARIECRIRQSVEAGDHVIHIGLAEAIGVEGELDPLLYFRGGYRNLAR
ncbi:flavin reductase family protein [bacterium]|nr:flavin reductase family protein [bacterium]